MRSGGRRVTCLIARREKSQHRDLSFIFTCSVQTAFLPAPIHDHQSLRQSSNGWKKSTMWIRGTCIHSNTACGLLKTVTHIEMERISNFNFVFVFFYLSMVTGYARNPCLEGFRRTGWRPDHQHTIVLGWLSQTHWFSTVRSRGPKNNLGYTVFCSLRVPGGSFPCWFEWCRHRSVVSMTLWLRWDKFTRTTESCGGKGTAEPLSHRETALTLVLTGFYFFSGHITLRMVLIY